MAARQHGLVPRGERQPGAVEHAQGQQVHDVQPPRPQRRNGRVLAASLDGDADGVRADGQAPVDGEVLAFLTQDDELVPFLVGEKDLPAVGEDRNGGGATADGDLGNDAAAGHIDE